ncbi:MAG: hypothetical protein JWM86_2346 [Thermoleophilia bacterium]|nr:hypothetical protein [Thermoleophilia bacterium]
MKPRAATIVALLLIAASLGVLAVSPASGSMPMLLAAVVGVLGCALLALTAAAWRWRARVEAYTRTIVDSAGFYEELAATFDFDHVVGIEESARAV